MTVALVALAIAQTASVLGFLRYLHLRDQRDGHERQIWANRVQDPPAAIAQTIVPADYQDPGYQTEFSPEEWPHARIEASE